MRFYITIVFICIYLASYGSEVIVIKDNNDDYLLIQRRVDVLEDPNKDYTFEQISSLPFRSKFLPNKNYQPTNHHLGSAYWIKFTVLDSSIISRHWIVELLDFRIDKFDIYMPDGNGGYIRKNGGDIYPFNHKYYEHKNFIFDLPPFDQKEQTYYFRIESKHPVGMIGAIRSFQKTMAYSTTEYLALSLFYGVVLAMVLYNLFLFLSIKETTYIYYVLYVVSIGIYCISQDGLGFEYLWPNFPKFNDYAPAVALYSMVIWVMLYARSFLDLKVKMPLFNKIIIFLIILRTVLFVLGFFVNLQIIYHIWIDLLPLSIIYLAGIISWRRGFRPARFYVIAFTLLFCGFLVAVFQQLHIIRNSIFSVYSFNFGIFGEMILLSLALADRIKILMKERAKAQTETIVQLQEKEMLKDKVNQELEQKVLERTTELKAKNEQLDDFVYKASHDIKGPLKSIIGLTTVGMKDIKDREALVYFEEILKSTKKLDTLLSDLLALSKIKEVKIEKVKIDFDKIANEVLKSFSHVQNYERLKFSLLVTQKEDFYSDEKMVYSIIQNMIENAIKYMDLDKPESFLKIEIVANSSKASLQFTDNGLGIPAVAQPKIFDMFYKVNPSSPGTGLGLYLVKISLERLDGKIELKSEEGKGSTFLIKL